MPNATIIPTDQPTDLTTFTIKMDGEAIPRAIQVLSVVICHEVNRIPSARIVIADGDPAGATFAHSEGELFRPGVALEIDVGYHSDEQTVFKGLVTSQQVKVRRNGTASLCVEARDPAFKMTAVPKYRFFKEAKDKDVINEILGEHGLSGELEDTATEHEHMVQNQVTDWDFVLSRLEANGQLLTLDDGTLTSFVPDPGASEVVTVAYGSTVFDADLELDSRLQLATLKAKSWSYTDQAVLESESAYKDEPAGGDMAVTDLADLNDSQAMVLNSTGQTVESELSAWADAHKMKRHFAKIRGTITFQGFNSLLAGNIVELNGFGSLFNGNAFVSGVRHEIQDGGFLTRCQIGLDPTFLLRDEQGQTGGQLVPHIKGLHTGVVLQLEADPKGEHRILVHVPLLHPEGEGVWSRVCTLDAGDTRGSFFLPEIDDEVVVGFFANDPRHAVVLGMMNSSAKPAPLTAADDNHEKGFFTRSEMKVAFNDDTKTIEISTPKGNVVRLDEDEGVIHIEDENGNVITLSSDGILIESCKDIQIKAPGDVTVEGTNISHAASAEFKADGGAGAELTTGAVCKVQGSLVQIN